MEEDQRAEVEAQIAQTMAQFERVQELAREESISVELFELVTRLSTLAQCSMNMMAVIGFDAHVAGDEDTAGLLGALVEHVCHHMIGGGHD